MHKPELRHLPYLDGWRGLAILGVFAGHFGSGLAWVGPFGVALFFVLSGYLMSELLFVRWVALPDFFARRASRIVPTFWLFVVCMAGWSCVRGSWTANPAELLATLTFTRTYLPADFSIWASQLPIGHIWSLNVEEHTYIFLALVALLAGRGKRGLAAPALLASVVLLLVIVFWYRHFPPAGASPYHLRSEVAAIGIVSAAALRLARQRGLLALPPYPLLWAPLALALAAVCFSSYTSRGVDLWVAPLCLACVINVLDKLPAAVHACLSLPLLRWFGRCSFSLYLWQQPFFIAVKAHPGIPPLLLAAAALLTGALSFYAFEDPVRVWLNRAWARRPRRSFAVPVALEVEEDMTRDPG
ncbi:MAG: acyltransferase family protein [Telluria sp.]